MNKPPNHALETRKGESAVKFLTCRFSSVVFGFTMCVSLSSCLVPDVHYARHPVSSDPKGFWAIRMGQTTRSEIATRFGSPDESYPEMSVSCYRLNELTRYRLWLALGVLPVSVTALDDKTEVAFIQFDEHGVVQRCSIVKAWRLSSFKSQAEKWSAKN